MHQHLTTFDYQGTTYEVLPDKLTRACLTVVCKHDHEDEASSYITEDGLDALNTFLAERPNVVALTLFSLLGQGQSDEAAFILKHDGMTAFTVKQPEGIRLAHERYRQNTKLVFGAAQRIEPTVLRRLRKLHALAA